MIKTNARGKKKETERGLRKEGRFLEENKVVFTFMPLSENSNPSESYNALTLDLSAGGARIITRVPIPQGILIQMELALSRVRKLVHITAKVCWVHPLFSGDLYEAGIEFVRISPEDQLLLLNYAYKRDQEL